MLAPIVLFVYNRPSHTRQVIEALMQNTLSPQSDLIIYSDAPKNPESADSVLAVRAYITEIKDLVMTRRGGAVQKCARY